MSYVFRLHNQGTKNLIGWDGDDTTQYGDNVIKEISDSSPKSEITSIPSPFARIDLFKTAFRNVVKLCRETGVRHVPLDGNTIYHKMVSACLDVGQIFFEFEKHQDKLQILVWDKEGDLNTLLASSHSEHKQLGETYKIFLECDRETYHFDRMNRIFLLNLKDGPAEMNIIGATSPATLFFSPANDLNYVGKSIQFGNHKPFGDQLCPLYKRDYEYQKYWYLLRKTIPQFEKLFPEVEDYLAECLKNVDANVKNSLAGQLNPKDIEVYSNIDLSSINDYVHVLNNIPLKQLKSKPEEIEQTSGFVVQSDYKVNGVRPLILPVSEYRRDTRYTKDTWNNKNRAPYEDADPKTKKVRPLADRTLPFDGAKYPYITISDLLTDTIVRMPYEMNREHFFHGNIEKAGGKSYLLPLKDLFFQMFTPQQLREGINGQKMFELQTNTGGITAVLRIPVRDNIFIEYRRIYFEAQQPNIAKNDGALIEESFGLGIMPLGRFADNEQKHYRIALFEKGQGDLRLECYDGNRQIPATAQVVKRKKDLGMDACSIESYVVNDNFDRIKVKIGDKENVIVPIYKVPQTKKNFTFAVDFGTTNTHIECSADKGATSVSFDMTAGETQLKRLHLTYASEPDIANAFVDNFVPTTISDSGEYFYPMRTILAEQGNIDYTKAPHSLADANILFIYEKLRVPQYFKQDLNTDLKWTIKDKGQVQLYMENLCLLMRNKVLLNGGALENTKIIWFYPASMTEGRCNKLKKIWEDLYKKYFGDNLANLICMSESEAPYHYFAKKQGAFSNVVTIDIGGGTTDVYIIEKREPKLLLSFRFASNAVFGDGYNWDSDNNGFVKLYAEEFRKMLDDNGQQELGQVLSQIEAKKNSPDIIAFLFSLATNMRTKDNKSLNFLDKLADNDRLKYVFIIFYSAILYFVAKTMKAKGLEQPLTLAFSGNGSKTLRILSNDKNTVGKFAKLIFDGVYGTPTTSIMDVKMEDEPKKATCKGGIQSKSETSDFDATEKIKYVPTGKDWCLGGSSGTDEKISYSEITPAMEKQVEDAVVDFVEFLFKLHRDNDNFLVKKFVADGGITQSVKDICSNRSELKEFLTLGLNRKYEEIAGRPFDQIKKENLIENLKKDNKIEETLFFYPLLGILNKLAREISNL